MEADNVTVRGNGTDGYAMEVLFRDHHVILICICLGSLILGVPLAWNALWHLKARFAYCNEVQGRNSKRA